MARFPIPHSSFDSKSSGRRELDPSCLYHEEKQETDHKELTVELIVLKPYHLGDFCERTEEKCSTGLVKVACKVSTWEGEAGGWLRVQGQQRLYI